MYLGINKKYANGQKPWLGYDFTFLHRLELPVDAVSVAPLYYRCVSRFFISLPASMPPNKILRVFESDCNNPTDSLKTSLPRTGMVKRIIGASC